MSSTVSQPVASSVSSFIDPAQAQENFHSQFDLENPIEAVSNYARMMHEHTQRQMNLARRSASRRSVEPTISVATLTTGSSMGSLDSRGS